MQEEFQREKAALEARAAKFGLELNVNPYGEDLHPTMIPRREIPTTEQLAEMAAAAAAEGAPPPTVEVTVDTLHVHGVDRLSTDEMLQYFGDYSPSYVLWLDDRWVPGGVMAAYLDARARRAHFESDLPTCCCVCGVLCSSANIVFGDAANARRALFSLCQPIRLPAPKTGAALIDMMSLISAALCAW